MIRAKFKKDIVWERQLIDLQAYSVESEVIPNLLYLADQEKFAVARGSDLCYWDIENTVEESKNFIPKVRQEILEIFEDIKYLACADVIYNRRVFVSAKEMR